MALLSVSIKTAVIQDNSGVSEIASLRPMSSKMAQKGVAIMDIGA